MSNIFEQNNHDEIDFIDAISYFNCLNQVENDITVSEQPSQDYDSIRTTSTKRERMK